MDLRSSSEPVTTIEAGFLLTGVYPPPIVYINGEARFASCFPREEICQEVARLLQPQEARASAGR